ncbi:MAG TPA: aminoglycoside phosphotransferase family protein [Candidatus Acidoferrum sp.]|nr:aminoglycoside phosphotransferase family protein [Candidatus Acidoferrum sp.]
MSDKTRALLSCRTVGSPDGVPMLSQHEVVPYLLARGLLASQSVVEGDLVVDDVSRRNHNFLVASPSGRYLLKQAVGRDRVRTISREAAFYRAVCEKENGFSRYLPKFYLYDQERNILIIESLESVETLREQQLRTGRSSRGVAEKLAEALAALHQFGADFASEFVTAGSLRARLPYRPDLEAFRSFSGGGIEVIKVIQANRDVADVLDQLTEDPKESSVIHGDVRGDNFLVPAVAGARRERWLKIIDFELATCGDPAVDIGWMFADYLSQWIFSLPLVAGYRPDRFDAIARWPLRKVQPLIRSFWRRYVSSMGLDRSQSDHFRSRAVKHCGARLLHLAMETTYTSYEITRSQLCLLQVGTNVLLQPEEASIDLMGIGNRGRELDE